MNALKYTTVHWIFDLNNGIFQELFLIRVKLTMRGLTLLDGRFEFCHWIRLSHVTELEMIFTTMLIVLWNKNQICCKYIAFLHSMCRFTYLSYNKLPISSTREVGSWAITYTTPYFGRVESQGSWLPLFTNMTVIFWHNYHNKQRRWISHGFSFAFLEKTAIIHWQSDL